MEQDHRYPAYLCAHLNSACHRSSSSDLSLTGWSLLRCGHRIHHRVVRRDFIRAAQWLIPSLRYKQLQPDYTEYLARAFAASLNRTGSDALANPIPDLTSFQRPALARGVNTLWFLSLALALVAALLAILAKQWLNEYTSRMRRHTSSHRRWAWRHFVYYGGLEKWGLEGFISFLPAMLHAALVLFLAGLVGFLADIDWVIGGLILVLTVAAAVFYVGSTLAPFWFGDCPTATPLLGQVRRAVHTFSDIWDSRLLSLHYVLRSRLGLGHNSQMEEKEKHLPASGEEVLLHGKGPTLDAKILEWMITSLPASEEIDAALDAIGSLDPIEHQHSFHEECPGVYGEPLSGDPLCSVTVRSAAFSRFWRLSETGHPEPAEVASTLRAMLFLCYNPFFDIADPLRLRDVNQAVHLSSFLDRWEKHTTHDLRLLATAVTRWFGLGFLDEVADNLSAWVVEGDHGDITGQLPYLASSLALSFLPPPQQNPRSQSRLASPGYFALSCLRCIHLLLLWCSVALCLAQCMPTFTILYPRCRHRRIEVITYLSSRCQHRLGSAPLLH